jgi:light-regulated signal transduction histidine kinase (bacteriophytochrome)
LLNKVINAVHYEHKNIIHLPI